MSHLGVTQISVNGDFITWLWEGYSWCCTLSSFPTIGPLKTDHCLGLRLTVYGWFYQGHWLSCCSVVINVSTCLVQMMHWSDTGELCQFQYHVMNGASAGLLLGMPMTFKVDEDHGSTVEVLYLS